MHTHAHSRTHVHAHSSSSKNEDFSNTHIASSAHSGREVRPPGRRWHTPVLFFPWPGPVPSALPHHQPPRLPEGWGLPRSLLHVPLMCTWALNSCFTNMGRMTGICRHVLSGGDAGVNKTDLVQLAVSSTQPLFLVWNQRPTVCPGLCRDGQAGWPRGGSRVAGAGWNRDQP